MGISLIEVKNAAFGAMTYSSSRTLWGGNGEWNHVLGWSQNNFLVLFSFNLTDDFSDRGWGFLALFRVN